MNVDLPTIVILILSALVIGGGGYAVIVKKKLGAVIAVVGALLKVLEEYQKSIADGTVTPEEKDLVIKRVMDLIVTIKDLFSPTQVIKAIKKLE